MKYDAWDITDRRPLTGEALCETLLRRRGIPDGGDVHAFLNPGAAQLHDPFLLPDMERAVSRIRQAADTGERVAIYGDYDADGITATCILLQFLRSMGVNCIYYIPDRFAEGYGLNANALASLGRQGITLLITVDTGVTALQEAELAAGLGMDLIITDHHACRETLPRALAILHPALPESEYPFPFLSGAGVVYKLLCALSPPARQEALMTNYGTLAAIGTIADVVPLVGENRALAHMGLRAAAHTGNIGLRALMREAGVRVPLTASSVAFTLAPRINAAGRLDSPGQAAALLLTEDSQEAARLAVHLCDLNRKRQTLERIVTEQAFDMLRASQHAAPDDPYALGLPAAVVLAHSDWHLGVLGIAAAKMAESIRRPVFLLALEEDAARGSARSAGGADLAGVLSQCAPLLTAFGGHARAAGLSLPAENIPALRESLCDLLRDAADTADAGRRLRIDAVLHPSAMTLSNARTLAAMEPFGAENPQPVFLWEHALLQSVAPLGDGRHVRLGLRHENGLLSAVGFGFGHQSFPFSPGSRVDAAFYLEENVFRGQSSLQLRLCDLRLSR